MTLSSHGMVARQGVLPWVFIALVVAALLSWLTAAGGAFAVIKLLGKVVEKVMCATGLA